MCVQPPAHVLVFCIPHTQIAGADPDTLEEKKRNIAFRDIECLAFSFKNIAKVDSLKVAHGHFTIRSIWLQRCLQNTVLLLA